MVKTNKYTWILTATYQDYDSDYDYKLCKKVGRLSTGSGYGLFNGHRNIDWEFKQEPAARRAHTKLKQMKRVFRTSLEKMNEDWEPIEVDY